MLNAGMMGVQPGMNGMASAQFNMMRNGGNPNMANGAMGNDGLRRAALQRQVTPPPLTHELPDNTMNRPGMQPGRMNQPGQPREGELAGDGQRAPSPMSGDTAPSPKRQRIGEGPPGMSNPPMARPGMPGQMPNGAMMPGGFDAEFPVLPPSSADTWRAGMKPNPGMGTPGQMPQGSPVMTGPEGQMAMPGDMFPNGAGQMQRGMGGTNNNQQGGALADYQMQLMLLEQQNKKRLLMARQEQEVVNNGNGQQGGATGQGMMGQGHFGGNPSKYPFAPYPALYEASVSDVYFVASPMPGGGDMQRNSPAPGFDANMQMHNPMFMKPMAEGGMPPMMRPPGIPGFSQPSPQQLEMMRRNGAPMPGGQAWPQGAPMPGPMGPGGPQGTPGPGDNGQRGQMPPPSAPAGNNAGRTQPSSPSQTQNTAPPTPQQGNKANPKKGKNAGKKDDKVSFGAARMEEMEELTFTKKAPKKGSNATGTTSAKAGGNAPSSPPPAPPITPQNRDSFSFPQGQPNPGSGPGGQAPGPAASTGSEGPPDANAQAPFGNIDQSGVSASSATAASRSSLTGGQGNDPMDNLFNTPYGGEGGVSTDVLDGFDFESFLHMDGTESMDPQFPFDQPFMHDSMEMPGQS